MQSTHENGLQAQPKPWMTVTKLTDYKNPADPNPRLPDIFCKVISGGYFR